MIELNKIYNESCLDTLSRMSDESIDCVITSPPYWQLRDYGYEGQWGLEPTFELYLENLWSMMDEIFRVLKKTGTVWINLGDTYGTQSGNMKNPVKSKESEHTRYQKVNQPKSINKSLLLIPHRFAIGCIDRGWLVRNDIVWAKRNAMPEPVTDRFSKKHEYFFLMAKSEKYFFDIDAIRDKNITKSNIRNKRKENYGAELKIGEGVREWNNENGKNPGDVADFWDIPTKGSSEKHYASYNDALLRKPVLAGCPIGGIIYDPFMGTGTTAKMCIRTNRNFIGSEMGTEYVQIYERGLSQQVLF